MLDGLAAAVGVEVPDKTVGDQAHTREHDALLPGGPQIIEPPEPGFRATQLYAVESCRGCELPLLENVIARKDVLLTRQLHLFTPTFLGPPNVATRPRSRSPHLASLERAGGKAPDEVLLEDKEEDHHGDGHYQAPRGGELILSRPTTREKVEARGEHLVLRSLQVYQWQQKVVPRLEEHQHRQNRHTRHRQRQHNAPEDLELRGAFDPGGVRELLRQVHVERAHQEHAQGQAEPGGAGYGGEDHRRLRAKEAQALQLVEERDHHREERDHEPQYKDEEDDVGPREVQTRQRVTRQGRQGHHADHGYRGDHDRVPEVRAEAPQRPRVVEVHGAERAEKFERVRGDVQGVLEGGRDDQEQR